MLFTFAFVGARIAHLKSQLCSVRLWCMCWKMVLFFFLIFFVITAWQSEFWSSFWKLVGLASNSPWLSWFCADCPADISPCQHAHLSVSLLLWFHTDFHYWSDNRAHGAGEPVACALPSSLLQGVLERPGNQPVDQTDLHMCIYIFPCHFASTSCLKIIPVEFLWPLFWFAVLHNSSSDWNVHPSWILNFMLVVTVCPFPSHRW